MHGAPSYPNHIYDRSNHVSRESNDPYQRYDSDQKKETYPNSNYKSTTSSPNLHVLSGASDRRSTISNSQTAPPYRWNQQQRQQQQQQQQQWNQPNSPFERSRTTNQDGLYPRQGAYEPRPGQGLGQQHFRGVDTIVDFSDPSLLSSSSSYPTSSSSSSSSSSAVATRGKTKKCSTIQEQIAEFQRQERERKEQREERQKRRRKEHHDHVMDLVGTTSSDVVRQQQQQQQQWLQQQQQQQQRQRHQGEPNIDISIWPLNEIPDSISPNRLSLLRIKPINNRGQRGRGEEGVGEEGGRRGGKIKHINNRGQ